MSIMWNYLDKRKAAVDALKDFGSMEFILAHTDEAVKNEYLKMEGQVKIASSTALRKLMYSRKDTARLLSTWHGSNQPGKNLPLRKEMSWTAFMLMMIAAQYIPSATATGLSGPRLIKKRIVPWTSW